MLKNIELTIDGKKIKLNGGVEVTYQPKVDKELINRMCKALKPIKIEFTQKLTNEQTKNIKSILNEIMQKQIDFTDLQHEVIDHWENEGVTYFETENNGFKPPDPTHYESTILPKYLDILDSPEECVFQLGYDSLAEYLAENQEVVKTPPRNITFFMSGVLNKQWRQHVRAN